MKVIESAREMRLFSEEARAGGGEVVLVPTMGCLHEGHAALVRKARSVGDVVVLSIFVNPAQFGPSEDYEAYPRTMEHDLAVAEAEGVDVVFTPPVEQMYPPGFSTYVVVEGITAGLCGASRPGHFRGVATVVTMLFNIVRPVRAVFGLKDYQQQLVVKRLVSDLHMDIGIVTVETVREPDGLAMSSRNRYLDGRERRAARAVPRSLEAARRAFRQGERSAAAILAEMRKVMDEAPLVEVEYLKICDPHTLEELDHIEGGALAAVAVRVGPARLIDNLMLG
ncbi:MAG TPA: pantoate--beta-alanine ligase [Deltaproteobacteria bacterium]|nr:pantoate--beta-alanine ligase [Deltaproteobacteria bacterium]